MKHRSPCSRWAEKLALRPEDLSPADRAALEAHLTTCAACATARADYDHLTAQLGELSLALLPSLLLSQENHREKETEEQLRAALMGKRLQPKYRTSHIGRAFACVVAAVVSLLLIASTLLAPFIHS